MIFSQFCIPKSIKQLNYFFLENSAPLTPPVPPQKGFVFIIIIALSCKNSVSLY